VTDPVRRIACAAGLLLILSALPGAGRVGSRPTPDDMAVRIARALTAEVNARDVVRCRFRFNAAGAAPTSVAFTDPRASAGPAGDRRVRDGGVLELFASPQEVAARQDQLAHQALQAQRFGFDEGGQPLRREHLLRSGPVLLRLSAALPDAVVQTYARALDTAVAEAQRETTVTVEEAPCST
jgi:hypothetical protein